MAVECSVRQPAKQQPAGLAPLSPLSPPQRPTDPSHTRGAGERASARSVLAGKIFWRQTPKPPRLRHEMGLGSVRGGWKGLPLRTPSCVCGGSDASAIYGGSNWRTVVEALTSERRRSHRLPHRTLLHTDGGATYGRVM